jgi:hypothetical protein
MGQPSEKFFLLAQFTGDATRKTISGSSTRTGALSPGMYLIYTDTSCRFKQGGSGVTVTSSTGTPVTAGLYFGPVYVDSAATAYFAVIGTSGTLELIPVGEG